MRIEGLEGRALDDAWREGAEAYLGIAVAGFPNLFLLYGPNTGSDRAKGAPSLHVDAAASAALLAVKKAPPGIYNVAEPCEYLSTEKAQHVLGFDPGFRLGRS